MRKETKKKIDTILFYVFLALIALGVWVVVWNVLEGVSDMGASIRGGSFECAEYGCPEHFESYQYLHNPSCNWKTCILWDIEDDACLEWSADIECLYEERCKDINGEITWPSCIKYQKYYSPEAVEKQ